MTKTFMTIYCSIDERLVRDAFIQNRLAKHKFKPSKNNYRLYYKTATEYNLEVIAKDLSVYWYSQGKRKGLVSKEFNNYVNSEGSKKDWEESSRNY